MNKDELLKIVREPTENQRAELDLLRQYNDLFTSDTGVKVLNDLKERCYFMTTTKGATIEDTQFNEGMRSVVLHILNFMDMHKTVTQL